MKPLYIIFRKHHTTKKTYIELITNEWEDVRLFLTANREKLFKLQQLGNIFKLYSKKRESVVTFDGRVWTLDTPTVLPYGC